MDIGEVLGKSWQTIWKHKALWIFGILASCTSGGNSGGSNVSYQFTSDELPPGIERTFTNLSEGELAVIGIVLLCLALLVVLLFIFLSAMGRIGLIKGTVDADQGMESITFGRVFSESMPYFWRVFGLNLIFGLALFFLILLFFAAALTLTLVTFGLGLICLIPLLCLFVPFAWLIGVYLEQANIALVVEDLGIMEALTRGWEVFRENLGTMFVMGLILILGSWVVFFLIGLPLTAVFGTAVASLIIGEGQVGSGLVLATLCFVLYLPVLIILYGIVRAYIGSAWTLTFLRLTGQGPQPELPELEPAV